MAAVQAGQRGRRSLDGMPPKVDERKGSGRIEVQLPAICCISVQAATRGRKNNYIYLALTRVN